jgi:hypothetical protein
MNLLRTSLTVAAILATFPQSRADPAPVIHYAPTENLEHVDVELIDSAKREIDFCGLCAD